MINTTPNPLPENLPISGDTFLKDHLPAIFSIARQFISPFGAGSLIDLSMLIDRWKTLNDSRRKLQTFQIGADSLSSVITLRDSNGNEFRTSNSAVITSVIDEMKRILDGKVKDVEELINL